MVELFLQSKTKMATESLLPLFYDGSAVPDDVDLTQLLNQNALLQDDEFLSGLLENENVSLFST